MDVVHYCAWPRDILIYCNGAWMPFAPSSPEVSAGVRRSSHAQGGIDYLYTFEKDRVTCPACLSKIAAANNAMNLGRT